MQTLSLQNRDEWLEERRKSIGASESAALFDASPWDSSLSLYAKKKGLYAPRQFNEAILWGSRFENAIADEWAERYRAQLENLGQFTILKDGRMSATLDPKIVACKSPVDEELTGPGILEIKKVAASKKREWEEDPPLYYQIQVQHQLAVTGWQWAFLAPLFIGEHSMELGAVLVKRNDAFISKLREKVEKFCEMLDNDIQPEADGTRATADALALLHPKDNGETIQLGNDLLQIADSLESVKRTISSLQVQEREFKNRLVAAIGAATFAELPDGSKYSYKTQTKKEHTVAETTFRVLRRKP